MLAAADYFLCVVNDFTSLDQRYLDRLTRSLQNSKKVFQEVIVVHNCKTVMEAEVPTARLMPSAASGACAHPPHGSPRVDR